MSKRFRRGIGAALVLGVATLGLNSARAAKLPVPCFVGSCGPTAPASWVTPGSGTATSVQSGKTLTINQTSNSVALNWQSFDISADGTVKFVQPSSTAIALNRIFGSDASPSQILGALNANGKVYLLNQNGFVFGSSSVVNVGGLVASSLAITDAAVSQGIGGAALTSQPAFQRYVDSHGNRLPSGDITVQAGASITSNQGQVLLFAPNVDNEGTIQTPNGQTVLGAGQTIFLAASTDPTIRGLLIQVGDTGTGGGKVTNGSVAEILANEGNVTLAGLAVNQNGRVSATTTVRNGGSILLQAEDTTATSLGNATTIAALPTSTLRSGTLVLGASSRTSVDLQGSSSDTTVDVDAQPKSNIDLEAGQIQILNNASVIAPSGNVTLNALSAPQLDIAQTTFVPDSSRIYLAPSSVIDVSGATVTESVSDNSLAVQLRGSELENSPLQRNGPLRGLTVYVDVRDLGTLNGTAWVGTPLADLTGDVSTIQRDVFQRNLTGGTITMSASGSVIVSPGATLNVSGGQIDWQSGYVKSSVLVGANGTLTPIAQANPDGDYVGTLDSISQSDPHWGSTLTATLPGHDPRGAYVAGYAQGFDAGTLSIVTPAVVLDGNLQAAATVGPLQRTPPTNFAASPLYPGQLYRPSNQVPLGGQLILGNAAAGLDLSDPSASATEVLTGLTFAPAAVLPTLQGPSGSAFDPLTDPLPSAFVSSLRPDILGGEGFSRLGVYAEGTINRSVRHSARAGLRRRRHARRGEHIRRWPDFLGRRLSDT